MEEEDEEDEERGWLNFVPVPPPDFLLSSLVCLVVVAAEGDSLFKTANRLLSDAKQSHSITHTEKMSALAE